MVRSQGSWGQSVKSWRLFWKGSIGGQEKEKVEYGKEGNWNVKIAGLGDKP